MDPLQSNGGTGMGATPTSSQTTSASPQPVTPTGSVGPSHTPAKTGIVAAIVAIVLIGGGVAWAYSQGYLSGTPEGLGQDEVLQGIVLAAESQDINTFDYSFEMSGELSGSWLNEQGLSQIAPVGESSTISLSVDGEVEIEEGKDIPNFTSDIHGEWVDESGANKLSFAAELIVVDETVYGKLTTVPLPFQAFVASFMNVWIEFPEADYGDFESTPLDPAERARVMAIFQENVPIEITSGPSRAKGIDGEVIYSYDYRLDKENFKSLYRAMIAYEEEQYGYSSLAHDEAELDQWLADTDITGSFAVDADLLPRHIDMTMDMKSTEIDLDLLLTISADIGDVNGSVSITAPAGAKTIEQIEEELYQSYNDGGAPAGSLVEARVKGEDAAIKSSISGAQISMELYYDSNGSYGPTSSNCSTGPFASAELASSIDFIREYSSSVSCYATADSYAISAALASGGTWCADSRTGTSAGTAAMSGGAASCKR